MCYPWCFIASRNFNIGSPSEAQVRPSCWDMHTKGGSNTTWMEVE